MHSLFLQVTWNWFFKTVISENQVSERKESESRGTDLVRNVYRQKCCCCCYCYCCCCYICLLLRPAVGRRCVLTPESDVVSFRSPEHAKRCSKVKARLSPGPGLLPQRPLVIITVDKRFQLTARREIRSSDIIFFYFNIQVQLQQSVILKMENKLKKKSNLKFNFSLVA